MIAFQYYPENTGAGCDASPSSSMLSEVTSRLKITLVCGSIPECSGDHLYNTCCILGTDGKLKGKHINMWSQSLLIRLTWSCNS